MESRKTEGRRVRFSTQDTHLRHRKRQAHSATPSECQRPNVTESASPSSSAQCTERKRKPQNDRPIIPLIQYTRRQVAFLLTILVLCLLMIYYGEKPVHFLGWSWNEVKRLSLRELKLLKQQLRNKRLYGYSEVSESVCKRLPDFRICTQSSGGLTLTGIRRMLEESAGTKSLCLSLNFFPAEIVESSSIYGGFSGSQAVTEYFVGNMEMLQKAAMDAETSSGNQASGRAKHPPLTAEAVRVLMANAHPVMPLDELMLELGAHKSAVWRCFLVPFGGSPSMIGREIPQLIKQHNAIEEVVILWEQERQVSAAHASMHAQGRPHREFPVQFAKMMRPQAPHPGVSTTSLIDSYRYRQHSDAAMLVVPENGLSRNLVSHSMAMERAVVVTDVSNATGVKRAIQLGVRAVIASKQQASTFRQKMQDWRRTCNLPKTRSRFMRWIYSKL